MGTQDDGTEVKLPPYGQNVLLVGTSGSGKSTLATGFLERLAEQKYTFCIIDPEGDYDTFAGAVTIGAPTRPPTVEEIVQLLREAGHELHRESRGTADRGSARLLRKPRAPPAGVAPIAVREYKSAGLQCERLHS